MVNNETRQNESKKMFISQPLAGRSGEQIREIRKIISDFYEPLGWTIMDSYVKGQSVRSKNKKLWIFSRELQTIADSDVVFFAPGAERYISGMYHERMSQIYNMPTINWADVPELSDALMQAENEILKTVKFDHVVEA